MLGSISTGLLVYIWSGDIKTSLGVGAFDIVAKIGLYFVHERVWDRISFGRENRRAPDYEI